MTPAPGPALRDIHVPAADAWPWAPGWWILAGTAALVLVFVGWRCWRGRAARRRWRRANAELDALLRRCRDDGDVAAFAAGVSALLRRAARLRAAGHAGLRGDAWRDALVRLADGRVDVTPLRQLDAAMYRPYAELDVEKLATTARRWLRRVLLRGGRHA